MAFNGKLVELKTAGAATYTEFPLKLIQAESYKITPAQRLETSATRASTGVLRRTTLSHTASKIDFTTIPLTNSDVNTINTMLTNAYTDPLQRMLDIRYYDPASDSYKTGTVYVPDIDYNIMNIDLTKNVIQYSGTRFAFIEY